MSSLDRRRFLQTSAAVGSLLLATGIGRPAAAATRIEVPAVDRIVSSNLAGCVIVFKGLGELRF
jgi:hypothetical protein